MASPENGDDENRYFYIVEPKDFEDADDEHSEEAEEEWLGRIHKIEKKLK